MLEYLHVVGTSPMVQITNRGFMGSKWLPHARTMIFWSRSYLCIFFLENPLVFWTPVHWKCIYIFPETLWIWRCPLFESPYLYTYFPCNPQDYFGDANSLKSLESPCQQGDPLFPETLNPLDLLLPLKHLSPAHLILYTHQPPHTGSKLCYVRVPRGVGQRGGNPLSLESLEPFSLWFRWVNWGRKWIFAPLETLGPKLYCVGAPRGMGYRPGAWLG